MAQVLGRYGFCLHIARLEGITGSGGAAEGYTVLLTNDHLYWDPPKNVDNNDANFVIHEDHAINGAPV